MYLKFIRIQSTFLLLILIQLFILSENKLETKRIILTIFPGGHTHNIVIQNLLDYTILHQNEFKYEYFIISHKIDSEIWEKKLNANNNSFKLYTYGDSYTYEEAMNSGIEDMNNNPTFGFFGFNKAMILNIKHFMESDILNKLKAIQKEHKKLNKENFFHMIATDVPNFIHKLLFTELNIELSIYIQPAFILPIYYPNFELNSAYTPMIGTVFNDEMTLLERIKNSFSFTFTKILFKLFQMYQTQIINSYGYDLDNNIHIYNSFHFIQYPLGLCSPLSLPPNFILLGSITSQSAKKIEDQNIEKILNKYNKNIYMSNGTLQKIIININVLIAIFNYLNKEKIGVIISVRENDIEDKYIKTFPENVYVSRWLEQNDILGDKRINFFITHGGFNSVQESVYHGKPMIVLGVNLDHINIATLVKKKGLGEVFQKKDIINKENIISAIKKILNSKEYENNAKRIGEILRNIKNPREEFKYWIDYGFKFGYQHLEIPAYKYKYSWIIVNGYDITFIWVIIFIIFLYIVKKIYNCIHDCLCGKCENKHKSKRKGEHYKFD